MKVRIVVEDVTPLYGGARLEISKSEVWSGELELLRESTYITKISLIGEGMEHPLCDVPFSMDTGHWLWVPGVEGIPRRFTSLIVENEPAPQFRTQAEEFPDFHITPAALAGPDALKEGM